MPSWKVVIDDNGKWSVVTDPPYPTPCDVMHSCHCGTGGGGSNGTGRHIVGQNGCKRRMEDTPVATDDADLPWEVDGVRITDYTLRDQRGYTQHACGCWSSWNGSKTSMEFD